MDKKDWPWSESNNLNYASNSKWPKISLVTPSYNQGQFIEETILSIVNQNYPNLEYIIIDGGSTDKSVEIIKKYERHITYWVSEPDKGQGDAINKGLAQCTGDIFNWVNSDDLLAPNSLLSVGQYFQTYKLTVLAGFRRRFEQLNSPFPISNHLDRIFLSETVEASLVHNHFIQLPTFFSMSVIRALNGVNPVFHYTMDSELWQRYLLEYGQDSVMSIDECLGFFRLHTQSKTMAKAENFYVEANQFYQGLYAAVKLHPDAIRLLTNNLLTQPNKYVLTHVNAQKIRKYAYAKLLQHHIGLGSFKMFFSYFLRYLHASGSFYSGITLLGRILKRRLLVRI